MSFNVSAPEEDDYFNINITYASEENDYLHVHMTFLNELNDQSHPNFISNDFNILSIIKID